MSDLLNTFNICSKIDESLRNDIKLIDVFESRVEASDERNVLFVTIDDRVFGFGYNMDGVLGFGHCESVEKPQELLELRYKKVKEFFVGPIFVVALTEDNRVYNWGNNSVGQLGRDVTDDTFLKPKMVDLPNNQYIVQICCGTEHTLVLTLDGQVYGIASKGNGLLGWSSERDYTQTVTKVHALEGLSIKSICCDSFKNFVLTNDGKVLSWGSEKCYLGRQQTGDTSSYVPSEVTIDSYVTDLCIGKYQTYLLTKEGTIFFCGNIDMREEFVLPQPIDSSLVWIQNVGENDSYWPQRMTSGVKFRALNVNPKGSSLAVSDDNRVYLLIDDCITRTKYKSVLSYLIGEKKISGKTIKVKHINRQMNWMANLFNDQKKSDIKFMVKHKDSEQYDCIYGHKLIVTEMSEYFGIMFSNNWSESVTNQVWINGYSYEAYYQYIRWLYTDCFDAQDVDLLLEMLSLGEEYLDHNFKYKCVQNLNAITNVNCDNCLSAYCYAIEFGAKELEELSFAIITKNMAQVCKLPDFWSMNPNIEQHFYDNFYKQFIDN